MLRKKIIVMLVFLTLILGSFSASAYAMPTGGDGLKSFAGVQDVQIGQGLEIDISDESESLSESFESEESSSKRESRKKKSTDKSSSPVTVGGMSRLTIIIVFVAAITFIIIRRRRRY